MKKFTKLLLVATGMLTSTALLGGWNNNNITKSGEPTAVKEKVNVMFLLDEKYEVSDTEGFTLDQYGHALLKTGTQIKFKIKIKPGVKIGKDGLIVCINGNEIAEVDGFYKTTVNKDTEITVSGFAEDVSKYRVTVKAPYGVKVINENIESFPDGSYLLEEGQFDFRLEYLEGFAQDNLLVKVDGNEIKDNAGVYSLNIKKNTLIEISGVSFKEIDIKINDSPLYIIDSVKGMTLKDGGGYAKAGSNISFSVLPSVMGKVSDEGIVVKVNENVLTAKDGIYSFTSDVDTEITVSGIEAISKTSLDGKRTCSYNLINEVAFTKTGNGSVVSGKVSSNHFTSGGYKYAYYVAGEYAANQLALNSNDTIEKYETIKFGLNPLTSDYIEFYKKGGKEPLFNVHNSGYVEILIKKQIDCFHIFVNNEDKGDIASFGDMISDIQMRIQGTYLFTEMVGMKDVEYIDPHHYIDIKALADATYVDGSDEQTEYGTRKWYQIEKSSYGVGKNYSSLNPEKYTEITYDIMPVGDFDGGPWFGFNAAGSIGGFAKDTITTALFTKLDSGKWDLTIKGTKESSIYNLDLGTDLGTLKMFLHPNKGSVNYLVSNFRVVDDPEYDEFGQKKVTIVANDLQHVTYQVEGQSESSFKVNANSDIKLTLNVENGYRGIVKVNGDVISGNNNVYIINISRTTIIEILEDVYHEINLVTEKISGGLKNGFKDNCFVSYDPTITTVYTNNAAGGTLYPSSSADITGYKHLYFYAYNKANTQIQLYPGNTEQDCTTAGKKGEVVLVEFDLVDNKWNVSINGELSSKLSGKTNNNNFANLFYAQYWGTIYVSALYGYKI